MFLHKAQLWVGRQKLTQLGCANIRQTQNKTCASRVLPSSNNNQQRNANKENKDCVDRYLSGHFGSDPDMMQITRAGGKVCMAKSQHL